MSIRGPEKLLSVEDLRLLKLAEIEPDNGLRYPDFLRNKGPLCCVYDQSQSVFVTACLRSFSIGQGYLYISPDEYWNAYRGEDE